MDILNTKALLALSLSGAMSVGTTAGLAAQDQRRADSQIISVSSPDIRITVYDGIATVVGKASSSDEASTMEKELLEVAGVDYVINLITWS